MKIGIKKFRKIKQDNLLHSTRHYLFITYTQITIFTHICTRNPSFTHTELETYLMSNYRPFLTSIMGTSVVGTLGQFGTFGKAVWYVNYL